MILYKTDLARKLIQWKTQVAEWKQESSEALIKKVTCRVPKTKCGLVMAFNYGDKQLFYVAKFQILSSISL